MSVNIIAKFNKTFSTPIFKKTLKEYFQEIFPKILESYRTFPAKGGIKFQDFSDMSYPMHILNGILPSMLYLEQQFLSNESLSKLTNNEDSEIRTLIKCTLLGITFHDINKLVGKSDLKESLKYVDEMFDHLGLRLSEEEKGIVKYLIMSAEDRTRYTIPDSTLPQKIYLHKIIKDYLIETVHMADSISLPPLESFSHTFRILRKKITNYFPSVHVFYFHDTPYEVLSRYIMSRLITRIDGKILLISPKGFIWTGKPIYKKNIEEFLPEIKNEFYNFLLNQLDDFLTCDWQKAQLDIFRYIPPTKDFIKNKLFPTLLEKKREIILYRGLPSDEAIKENIKKEIEKLEVNGKLEVMLIFKFILTLTPNSNEVKKLKKDIENIYYPDEKDTRNPVIKNINKILGAAYRFNRRQDELYEVLVKLITENYRNEIININEVLKSILSYAYIDDQPIFPIEVQDLGDKHNICSICGAKTTTVAREGVSVGFSPRGFTNRTVVSLRNTERKICKTCLAEVMLRKLFFKQSKDFFAVYIDACDYTTPILNAEKVVNYIENQIKGIKTLSVEHDRSYPILYGYDLKNTKDVLIPFLMFNIQAGKESEFLRRYHDLLIFASATGFKVYLTYALNSDRIRKESFVLDYAPKSLHKLKWDKIRIDELITVKTEFELLRDLAKNVGGRRWDNELVRILNDYASYHLSFFYHLFRTANPSGFSSKNNDKIMLVYKRIGGKTMGVIKKLADKASEIIWSGYTTSKQTWIIRTAIDALKIGVQRKLDKEDTIALMAGTINKKVKILKSKEVDDFCQAVYEDLYEKTWQNKIPSKTELKYWIYGFAFEYAKKSEEKYKKIQEEKNK